LLTGESDPSAKSEGDTILSGTFVAAGKGVYRSTGVGSEAYARSLTEEAQAFTLAHSELRAGLNSIIRTVGWIMAPTAALLLYSQISAHAGIRQALRGTAAGVVAMVPEGLVLLTTVAFAVGVLRLARKNLLVQELAAIETLARVDTLCLDKTGTITDGRISVRELRTLTDTGLEREAIGALAASDPAPNATLRAIGASFPDPRWELKHRVAFSAKRRWSGASFVERPTWVIGAPEVLLAAVGDRWDALKGEVEELASSGTRVLLLASSQLPLSDSALPEGLKPAAVLVLEDSIRSDAFSTIGYFRAEGIVLKILSGDHPRTAGSIARRAGVAGADAPADARSLPKGAEELSRLVEQSSVFGRVSPNEKRRIIRALQQDGHVVAMIGDGVNDILALKDADIGIAMGSGAPASRGVSQMVMLDDSFSTLPAAVAEGRKVINNIERVANLFVTKTVYSTLLALAIGVVGLPFPFLPRHLTLIGSLTIGIPGFFMALAPNSERAHPAFVSRVLRFSIPVGTLAAAATFSAYYLARGETEVSLSQAKTTATLVLTAVGFLILGRLIRPLGSYGQLLIVSMAASFGAVLALPWTRAFFDLELPPVIVMIPAVVILWVWSLAAAYLVPKLGEGDADEGGARDG
jgi:cation-transporting ATPase E